METQAIQFQPCGASTPSQSLHRSGSKMIGNKEGTWQTNGREGKGTSWWDRCTRAQIRDNYGDCWLKHVQASFNTTQATKKKNNNIGDSRDAESKWKIKIHQELTSNPDMGECKE